MISKRWIALLAGALLVATALVASSAWAEEAAPGQDPEAAAPVQDPVAAVDEEAEPVGSVARGQFTTTLLDREPQDDLESLPNDHETVYFFSELVDLEGETITHRWEFNGQVMAEVSFEVGGARWRTFSSKNLQPIWLGDWTVTVVDSQERILSTKTLTIMKAEAALPAKAE